MTKKIIIMNDSPENKRFGNEIVLWAEHDESHTNEDAPDLLFFNPLDLDSMKELTRYLIKHLVVEDKEKEPN